MTRWCLTMQLCPMLKTSCSVSVTEFVSLLVMWGLEGDRVLWMFETLNSSLNTRAEPAALWKNQAIFFLVICLALFEQPLKVAVLTGGNRGIGLHVLEKLLICKMTVVLGTSIYTLWVFSIITKSTFFKVFETLFPHRRPSKAPSTTRWPKAK